MAYHLKRMNERESEKEEKLLHDFLNLLCPLRATRSRDVGNDLERDWEQG